MQQNELEKIRAANRQNAAAATTLLENAILKALQSNGDVSRVTVTVSINGSRLQKPRVTVESINV